MADLEPIPYPDAKLRSILERVKTIAMVGASPNWNRPSYFVMKYLQGKGYRVIPVNPGIAGKTLLGETVYASLRDIPDSIDMVDMFRASREAPGVVADAIAIGAKVVWMQLGIRNDEAAETAEAAGIEVVMNRCPKIEFGRLGGELSWSGVNSGIIRNRAPDAAAAAPDQEPPHGAAQRRLWVRDPRDPCGRGPGPDDGRALDPDLPDDGLRVRRRRPRRLALQPARFRLHLFPPDESDRLGARGADREPRGRPRRRRRRVGARRAVPDLLHADGAGRRVPCLAQPLWRLAYPIRAVVQEARLDLPFRRPDGAGKFPPGADPEMQGDLHREPRQSGRRRSRHRARRRNRARGRHSAHRRQYAGDALSLPADRARRRHRRPFDDQVSCGPRKRARGRGGRVRKIRLVPGRPLPVADRARAGLSRAEILREFRRLRLHHEGSRGRAARLWPGARADERVSDDHRR